MGIQGRQLGIIICACLIPAEIYFLTTLLNISIFFVIGLNAILVIIEIIDVTRYRPKYLPYLKYAAGSGIIIFLFIIMENLL